MEMVNRPYAKAFETYATQHPEVLCLSADLTSSCEIDGFRDRHPGQFLSLGMAEQNMLSFAGGLGLAGFRPFLHSFGVFLYRRPYDQLMASVAYPRRQDEHLVSRYQQVVKVGETRRLVDWASGDMSFTYDYRARLAQWRRVMEPRRVVVRRFERGRFKDDSLLVDFLDACGIDVDAARLELPGNRNESLGAEAVELLRLINLHLREDLGVAKVDLDHRDLVTRMAERCPGPPLSLPEAELSAFMAQWTDSNRAVAREFFSEAELFGPPRQHRDTVVDQRLDPDRLPHLLELLELPTEWLTPLGRISERENG